MNTAAIIFLLIWGKFGWLYADRMRRRANCPHTVRLKVYGDSINYMGCRSFCGACGQTFQALAKAEGERAQG